MESKIPAVVCVDVEPDIRSLDPTARPDWAGFERAVEDFARFRALLREAAGPAARFAWFLRMDPQIARVYGSAEWVASRYASQIRAIEESGDAVGLHIHPWRYDEAAGVWLVDFTGRAWGEHCVRVGFGAFARSFGRRCRIVRFGDRWLTGRVLALAARLGARYDLTVEPERLSEGPPERCLGAPPDYSFMPRRPYRPSVRDYRKPGTWLRRRLWMIPLSTGRLRWALRALEEQASRGGPGKPAETEGAYEGWIDRADRRVVAGWACDTTRPDRVVEVEIRDGDRPVAVVAAGLYRPDLAAAGFGGGRHAFLFPLAERLRDGREHAIRVRVLGTDFELRGGPVLLCGGPDTSPADDWRTLDLGADPSILTTLVETLLTTRRVAHLALVVRTSAACPEVRGNLERNLEYLAAPARASRLAFVTPDQAVHMLRRGLVVAGRPRRPAARRARA